MFCDYRMQGEILERVTQEKDLEVVKDTGDTLLDAFHDQLPVRLLLLFQVQLGAAGYIIG